MRRIPKTLQLLGHTITVRIVPKSQWDDLADQYDIADADAIFSSAHKLILICRGKSSYMYQLFCHELVHAVLDCMNSQLSYDEAFVDNFGGLLAQALKTAR